MIGSTNAGSAGNGGSSRAYAFINVSYPAGSVCTCTKGTTVLQASNTNGSYAFSIPEPGTWVVSCTTGSQVAEVTIAVLSEIVYNVTLSYHVGADYQEVEYLQGYSSYTNNNGLIKSVEYKPNLDTDDIAMDVYYDSSCRGSLFGFRAGDATWFFGFAAMTDFASGNDLEFHYPQHQEKAITKPVDGLLEYHCADHSFYRLGAKAYTPSSTTQLIFVDYVYFMGWNYSNYEDYTIRSRLVNGKVRSIMIKRNGEYIHKLYPCYRRSDSRPGFYDNVTGVFHSSAYTDPGFIIGPDVT